jgi:hypothetical protein
VQVDGQQIFEALGAVGLKGKIKAWINCEEGYR